MCLRKAKANEAQRNDLRTMWDRSNGLSRSSRKNETHRVYDSNITHLLSKKSTKQNGSDARYDCKRSGKGYI
jgi:hypothetical protein